MKEIQLTKGQIAIVDDEDYILLSKWKWHAKPYSNGDGYYAARTSRGATIRMHRQIMDAKTGEEVDHRDGHGLNNQRGNLRICTRAENVYNRKASSRNSSGYIGVFWHTQSGKWRARVRMEGKQEKCRTFLDPYHAALFYDFWATQYFGDFAKLNFEKEAE